MSLYMLNLIHVRLKRKIPWKRKKLKTWNWKKMQEKLLWPSACSKKCSHSKMQFTLSNLWKSFVLCRIFTSKELFQKKSWPRNEWSRQCNVWYNSSVHTKVKKFFGINFLKLSYIPNPFLAWLANYS